MRTLAPYLAVFSSKVREELQYRAAALAGLLTQTVFGFVIASVLLAFYASAPTSSGAAPLSASQTVAYVWLGQALFAMLPWNMDPAVAGAIQSGEVVHELLRPVSTYRLWFARALALRLVRSALRGLPMVLITMLVFPRMGLGTWTLPPPASLEAAALFATTLALAFLFSAALTVAMQIGMLWTTSADGLMRIGPSLVLLLSGNVLPLPLFPGWLQPFLAAQPFRGLLDTPSRIYAGDLVGPEAWSAAAASGAWLIVAVAAGSLCMRRGLDRLVVAGG